MKKLLFLPVLLFCMFLLSCGSTKYIEVPVETVKTEYRNQLRIDTVLTNDSIIIKEKGDTVFLEKYKYIYRVKELKDTVNITDTIPVVQIVEVTKEINKLYTWQIILMCLGGGLVVLTGYKIVKSIKT